MITDAEVATMIPAKDLERTRRFYEDVLGFTPDRDEPGAISYRTGGGRFNLYETEFAGTAQRTLIGWLADDIDAAVRDLANRGVSFESYGMPGLKTDERGIADMGSERAAWFKDPEGNLLSVWKKPKA